MAGRRAVWAARDLPGERVQLDPCRGAGDRDEDYRRVGLPALAWVSQRSRLPPTRWCRASSRRCACALSSCAENELVVVGAGKRELLPTTPDCRFS
jgi:hypothetical protein